MASGYVDQDSSKSVKQQAEDMAHDLASEVKHEVHNMRYTKEPVDPTQSDVLVRRHVTGISISFFVLIAIFLLAAIAGIALYQHGHHAGVPRSGAIVVRSIFTSGELAK